MSNDNNGEKEESGSLLAKINLVSSTAALALIARCLLYPTILGFVPGFIGSEPAHLVIALQLVNLRQVYLNHPKLLLESWLGRICLGVNSVCLSVFARNLYQGMFVVPKQFAQGLVTANVPPVISNDSSFRSTMGRWLSLIPLFIISRRGVTVDVQHNIPYADLNVVHPSMLERWKRTPLMVRDMSTLLLRGRMSKWLSLDVHALPPGQYEGKRPVLMYIHGGAWITGDKQFASMALIKRLASRGIVVCTINYRMSPEVAYPDHIIDCKRALLFIKKHCEVWGGDSNKVFVAGESAGGHLSSLMGCTGNYAAFQPPESPLGDTSVVGALPIYGVYDWMDQDGHLHEVSQVYGGVKIGIRPLVSLAVIQSLMTEDTKHMWEAYSPTYHLKRMVREAVENPKLPPFFLSHGTLDALTSYEDSRRFYEQILAVRAKFPLPPTSGDAHVTVEGGIHGFGYGPTPRSHIMADAFCDFIFYHASSIQ
ncbi:hypothetical protein BASA81_008915 [Batrachochytrium salamandrivorans]|nr:hypothetical protein BASA81_008915 [Batrachochytrium salamandrivorans]